MISDTEELAKKKNQARDQESKKRSSKPVKNSSGESWDPSTLPFLSSLLPGTDNLSKQEKQAIEQHQRETRDLLAAARRADEEDARRWIAQQIASTHSGALQWLRERDTRRQSAVADSAFLDPSDLLGVLRQVDGHKKGNRVSFRDLGPSTTPDPSLPLWATREGEVIPERRNFRPSDARSAPLVIYQDNDRIYAADGRPVQVVQRNIASGPSIISHTRNNAALRAVPGKATHGPSQNFQSMQPNGGPQWKSAQNQMAATRGGKPASNMGWDQDRNSDGWDNMNSGDPGRNGWDNNNSGGLGQDMGGWETDDTRKDMSNGLGIESWSNQNNPQPPNPSGSAMVVDEATGISFHPAEPSPEPKFNSW